MASRLQGAFLPPIDERIWGTRKELWISAAGIAFTLGAMALVAVEQGPALTEQWEAGMGGKGLGHVFFLVLAGGLVYGGLVYQITRFLYIRRSQPRRMLDGRRADGEAVHRPRLTFLVPSYKEQRDVIVQTLLSAALQPVPDLRVVLLIDDPPVPQSPEDQELLDTARALTSELRDQLAVISKEIELHLAAGQAVEAARCAARWLRAEAERWLHPDAHRSHRKSTHTDRFFACEILLDRAIRFQRAADSGTVDVEELRNTFAVTLTSFERKQHPNLSHQANKAMNLNSYIALMGGHWDWEADGVLKRVEQGGRLNVPRPDFIGVLDADSLILPDYARSMLAELAPSEHAHRAVAQTPYSAIPGAPGVLERVAGATTDIQYLIHQGFTAWEGTYWVGANAVIRFDALEDIEEVFEERGYQVRRFIQDRTVIEDTESTLDLALKGWTLHNVPRRLAYSATPADFGSLLIQRRRWSNGGLLILPKSLALLRMRLKEARGSFSRVALSGGETWLRLHYLISITTVNVGLLILLSYPFAAHVVSYGLPLTAVPYFALYGRDLRLMGYRTGDLFRVYALNLLLIPVHLGGVWQSVKQGIFRTHPAFPRTPKTAHRTAIARPYVAWILLLMVQWSLGAVWDFRQGYITHGLFAGANALVMAYALVTFIGWRAAWRDL
jgi:cellulose synthase/poly-beta-1,6-N-acetylglucosamine synthase-like glycosyltransferase